MIQSGMLNGFTSEETINLSQTLDRVLNELHQQKAGATFSNEIESIIYKETILLNKKVHPAKTTKM
jgi:hypothetical protein